MSDLVEKVAKAIDDAFRMQGSTKDSMARAAIAVVLEEAAKECDEWAEAVSNVKKRSSWYWWPSHQGEIRAYRNAALAIRALAFAAAAASSISRFFSCSINFSVSLAAASIASSNLLI